MTEYFHLIYLAASVVYFIFIVGFVLLERRSPTATLAWILCLVFVPILGVFLYLIFGSTRMLRIKKKSTVASNRLNEVLAEYEIGEKLETLEQPPLSPYIRSLVKLVHNVTGFPASRGNDCKILPDAAVTYQSIFKAIKQARHHIHVEFYIIRPDDPGKALRDLLIDKAAKGVEVRVLYDAVGSSELTVEFWQRLIAAGGQIAIFHPIFRSFRRRDRVDFRNHRKIVVIDGQIGFTGGINVGKEYLGLCPEIGYWRDIHIKIEGPAVLQLQKTFCEDWLMASDELLKKPQYYYPLPQQRLPGNATVSIVESGPDGRWAAIYRIYFQAIAFAQQRVWITSPYFIPDPVIEESLITVALRGVDVRILVPARNDHLLVGLASRSYYPDLMEAGAQIYEYQKGFLHAKTMVVDDWLGTVGSANMDIRSFRLNFELNAFIYDKLFVEQLADEFIQDFKHSKKVTTKSFSKFNFLQKIQFSATRLLSPLL